MAKLPEARQVFINFRGKELRGNFISHLEGAFDHAQIKYYIDTKEVPSGDLNIFFTRIEQSEIALTIFSSMYPESNWCLDELVKIMEQVKQNKLKIIPVFFNVTPEEVKHQTGEFGRNLYGDGKRKRPNIPAWEDALQSVPSKIGLVLNGNERELVENIVKSVQKVLALSREGGEEEHWSTDISSVSSNGNIFSRLMIGPPNTPSIEYGMEQRLKDLEEKLELNCLELTRIVGIVGMPGIGKTALADKLYYKWYNRFVFKMNIRLICEEPDWLKDTLLNGTEFSQKAQMFNRKIFVVLDDVSHKNQVSFLQENLERIKKGSKIVVTTRDKSSIAELVHDTYVVPGLNDKEALNLFKEHAFNDQVLSSINGNFMKLSEKFVDYAGGNPRALKELGEELCGVDKAQWEERLETLPHCCNLDIKTELSFSYDKLSAEQKDVFLDIACFFRSEEEDYVKCLLDTHGLDQSSEAVLRDLAEKLFVCISAGRVEMHNLLCTLGKELGSSHANMSGERMWDHEEIINTLRSEQVTINQQIIKVRGIFLDTSKVETGIPIDPTIFTQKFNKLNLRYLKIYDSLCPQQCEVDCKVNLPDGLEFPFEEIRYFHWLKFPLDELPPKFDPKNLMDLRLPYSKIKRVWEDFKETPWLKWVDLSYSTKLTDLSALSNAFHLTRLNLEGCKILDKLPTEMKKMKSLVYLNLKGCVMLSCLPEDLDLLSLKTLILSDCSHFNNFELTSENLEFLHLDGTAIESLPRTIQYFQKLVLLNLKDCGKLEYLPDCVDKLKALEELILSGCLMLQSFPAIREHMEKLQILLLDGTSIKELPEMLLLHYGSLKEQAMFQRSPRMNCLSTLSRLCLSRNDMICNLHSSISQLYNLKWMDVKYCKNLLSISTLPPNLQCLDAHACNSLKTVGSPLALLIPAQQVPSLFIFTNCEKLDHTAKNEIICYAHNKSRMISDAVNRHNKGLAFEVLVATCFHGSEVPAWFTHIASGAVLEPEMPRHWSESGFVGIALCAIVSFEDYTIEKDLQVKCICEFNNAETSSSYFNCHVGGLSETDDAQRTIKSTHVFIGYTNWLNINKFQEDDGEKECVPTKASIKFEVIDATGQVTNCEVMKCGFSLVYESSSWEASSRTEDLEQDTSSRKEDLEQDTGSRTEGLEQGENRWLGLLRRIRRIFKL